MFKTEILTEEERNFIIPRDEIFDSSREAGSTIQTGYENVSTNPKGFPNERVYAALMLGFRFQDEASRERWENGKDFEMYRDAVNVIS